ncbi:imelysin family protein [Octadecabacter sp. G9-8]|uniref:Imelysin family protein n=1 Tax=Octadecabacter dasysiphoniae TaxID=2909341 RepID=A0ABS9CZN0_9RHOB|nr:imelysin family protein [Octadecabacter dasysiphoniae]MCF2872659.1 imelysin family protein [Octadecabacter dasysiphoniae]
MKLALALILAPAFAAADPRVEAALDDDILPGFAALTQATQALADAQTCDVADAWNTAAAAWVAVSHLRFGPSEADNRAFALAFWPDPRGATPSALTALLGEDAPPIADASIAGRGFYAMEFLLFDPAFAGEAGRCDLIAGLADDANASAQAIENEWQNHYGDLMRETGNGTYRDDTEALQELYKSLTTGLDFTTAMRLGRPLGTFDRPRATRAEMRRSGRSLANVSVSLASLQSLAVILGGDSLSADIQARFKVADDQIEAIANLDGGPDLSIVSTPAGRIKVEALQQRIAEIRVFLAETLGPDLGVIEGFNAMDGD